MSDDRSYRPGDWYGIFGEHVSVLLPSTEKSRVVGLWELVDDGADFDELLDALIASGLRSLPGFVLVSEDISPTRVVIRGAARATFDTAQGEVVIDGGQATTWVERSLDGVTAARIETGIEDAEGPDFSIRDGLVRVARVDSPAYGAAQDAEIELAEADCPGPITDEAAEADAVIGVPVGSEGLASDDVVAEGHVTEGGVAEGHVTDDAASEEEVSDELAADDLSDGSSFGQETMPFQIIDDDPASVPGDQEPWGDDPLGVDEAQVEDAPVEEVRVEEVEAEEVRADESGDQAVDEGSAEAPEPPEFPWSANQGNVYAPPPAPENPFGAPSQPVVDAPAPDAPDANLHAPDQGAMGQGDAPSPWDRPADDQQVEAPQVDAYPVDAQPVDQSVDADDHDGHTVAGGWDPNQFQRQHPGIPGQPPAPSVTAQPVARLVLSSGETVDVDRAILIGRAPEARRFTSTAQPRLVTVVSPNSEVSSTHVEVRPGSGADHGSAVVTDMGSTNGTVLTLPGFGPEELQPGMAVQLIPGSLIDLGDGVTIQVTSI